MFRCPSWDRRTTAASVARTTLDKCDPSSCHASGNRPMGHGRGKKECSLWFPLEDGDHHPLGDGEIPGG